jgi:type IV pilus assembly protein PilW
MSATRITGKESGFTIVELLIYMVMFVVVLGAMYSIMISNTKSYSSQENRVEMTQDLRAAMNLMVREIRMAGCDPEDIDTVGFDNTADDNDDTDADSISFTMDVDASGAIADSEDINYYLNGSQQIVRRTGDGDVQPVAENITDLTFTYMYADGDLSTAVGDPDDTDADTSNDLADITRVQISIAGETATEDAVTGTEATRTQTSWVVVRNAGVDSI